MEDLCRLGLTESLHDESQYHNIPDGCWEIRCVILKEAVNFGIQTGTKIAYPIPLYILQFLYAQRTLNAVLTEDMQLPSSDVTQALCYHSIATWCRKHPEKQMNFMATRGRKVGPENIFHQMECSIEIRYRDDAFLCAPVAACNALELLGAGGRAEEYWNNFCQNISNPTRNNTAPLIRGLYDIVKHASQSAVVLRRLPFSSKTVKDFEG